jgi:hypothetical protein
VGAVVDNYGKTSYPTLEDVAAHARPYPVVELDSCETGLVLFAAAYLGHNDAVHFAEAGIRTTCVDRDSARLAGMRQLYPDDWSFVAADAWTFAEAALELETTYDAVSVDTFTGDSELRSLSSLELWTSIARRVVTATYSAGYGQRAEPLDVPAGWERSLFERAPGAYWLVLTRAPA